jgi:hypothetical protein
MSVEPESSLPCSQEFTTGYFPDSDESIPPLHMLFLENVVILPSNLCLGLPHGYLLVSSLTPWCIIFEKLIVTQLIKKYPAFFIMEPKGS